MWSCLEERLPDNPSQAQIDAALSREGEAIRARIPAGAAVTALCVEGQPCSSEELAQRMARWANQGEGRAGVPHRRLHRPAPFGVKALSSLRLSMSPMTFPHHLARVMLLEQIYRAYQINAGSRYHK